MQDFAVQIIGGTDALRAFAMQAPQAAGAMTGFEGKLDVTVKVEGGDALRIISIDIDDPPPAREA